MVVGGADIVVAAAQVVVDADATRSWVTTVGGARVVIIAINQIDICTCAFVALVVGGAGVTVIAEARRWVVNAKPG